jgi:hypothetical protein
MQWFWYGLLAYLGWVLAPVILAIALGLLVFLVVVIVSIPRKIKQLRCRHLRFHETMSCDAVCSACGKNLGFIGTWRKRALPK